MQENQPFSEDTYRKMKKIAVYLASGNQALSPSSLVHEAYLRLFKQRRVDWNNEGQVCGLAARMMHRVLRDAIRRGARQKRGGHCRKNGDVAAIAMSSHDPRVEFVVEALDRLTLLDPQCAQVVKLRSYCGMTQEEIATSLGVSVRTVRKYWHFACAWLAAELKDN